MIKHAELEGKALQTVGGQLNAGSQLSGIVEEHNVAEGAWTLPAMLAASAEKRGPCSGEQAM